MTRLCVFLILLIVQVSFAQPERRSRRAEGVGQFGQESTQRDLAYATNGGVVLKMDVYLPKKSDEPAPCAVYIHGGGWEHGSKNGGGWLDSVTRALVSRGYVVAAVDYRLAPDNKWPTFIVDCKTAVRYLRANAKKFNLDPKRIGTWGTSAGGHLVALLGTADKSAGLEGEYYLDQSSSVQAVVDMFGPSDIELLASGAQHRERGQRVFGSEAVLKKASPVTYVSKDDPPFLILHGENDTLVPPAQGKVLFEKLKAAGVEAKLVMVKNGAHGLSGANLSPSRDDLLKMIVDFFDEHLKAKK
jgi:acetyl esterase/lipase